MAGQCVAHGSQRPDDLTLLLRALGLHASFNNQASAVPPIRVDVNKPAPHEFADDLVIVALAAGAALTQDDTDGRGLSELLTVAVGRAKLDTADLVAVAPGELGQQWVRLIDRFCYIIENEEASGSRQLGEVSRSFSEGRTSKDSEVVEIKVIKEWADLWNEPAKVCSGKKLLIAEEENLVVLEQEIGKRFRNMQYLVRLVDIVDLYNAAQPTRSPTSAATADDVCKLILGHDAGLQVADRASHILQAAVAIVVGHAARSQPTSSTLLPSDRSGSSNHSQRTASVSISGSDDTDWEEASCADDGFDRVRSMTFGSTLYTAIPPPIRSTNVLPSASAAVRHLSSAMRTALTTYPTNTATCAPARSGPATAAAASAQLNSTTCTRPQIVASESKCTEKDQRKRQQLGEQFTPKRIYDRYVEYDALTKTLEGSLIDIAREHDYPKIHCYVYQASASAHPIVMPPVTVNFPDLAKFAVSKVTITEAVIRGVSRNIELRTFVSDWFASMRVAEGLAEDGPVAAQTKRHREFTKMLRRLRGILQGA
ncbi:hypothetical protein LTR86_000879 [Recurvomyces mirabilis]|nr:hypothetical protein LTR86_000879 [Recurvomyces mirabilis]